MKVSNPEIRDTNGHSVDLNEKIDLLDGILARDYVGKSLKVTVSGIVDTSKREYYDIRYSAVDEFGNETIENTIIEIY